MISVRVRDGTGLAVMNVDVERKVEPDCATVLRRVKKGRHLKR